MECNVSYCTGTCVEYCFVADVLCHLPIFFWSSHFASIKDTHTRYTARQKGEVKQQREPEIRRLSVEVPEVCDLFLRPQSPFNNQQSQILHPSSFHHNISILAHVSHNEINFAIIFDCGSCHRGQRLCFSIQATFQ